MSTSRKVAWCAWLIASIFYAYQYILRVMPNIMLPEIMQQFNIDAAVFGQFSGAYYIGYCLMHIPIGIMLDRYGPRRVMSVCILLTVIGTLPIIFAENWIYPIVGRFIIGAASSAAILGAFKIIRSTFKEAQFTRMLSFSVTIGLIGAIYGGVPVSYLSELYGHKAVVSALTFIGVIFACSAYLFIPDTRDDSKSTVISDIKTVFTNKKVMLVCCLAGLMVGPMEGFADAWGSEFFKQVYGFDTQISHSLTSMIYMGMCFAPILSGVAERTNNYIGTIAGAGLVMLIAFIVLISGLMTSSSIAVSLFVVGICCAYQILAIYKASTYVPARVAGLTTAVANMIIMSFGYFFHSTIGIIITAYGSFGSDIAFSYGISVIPITLFIGAAGFMRLAYKERHASQTLQTQPVNQ